MVNYHVVAWKKIHFLLQICEITEIICTTTDLSFFVLRGAKKSERQKYFKAYVSVSYVLKRALKFYYYSSYISIAAVSQIRLVFFEQIILQFGSFTMSTRQKLRRRSNRKRERRCKKQPSQLGRLLGQLFFELFSKL
jgi:hypothetical protein